MYIMQIHGHLIAQVKLQTVNKGIDTVNAMIPMDIAWQNFL